MRDKHAEPTNASKCRNVIELKDANYRAYIEKLVLLPSTHWIHSQGSRRKGQAPCRLTSWIVHRPFQAQVGLHVAFFWTAPRRLHYRASGQNIVDPIPFVHHQQPQHKHSWCDIARL